MSVFCPSKFCLVELGFLVTNDYKHRLENIKKKNEICAHVSSFIEYLFLDFFLDFRLILRFPHLFLQGFIENPDV